jgi:lipopolysaccharide transport system ATP-binding protein
MKIIKVQNLNKKYTLKPFVGYKTISDFLNIDYMRNKRKNDSNFFFALRDINFEIYKGEMIGIIGPNGAGKSTLLKILSRITQPTTGKVEIRGRVGSLLEVGTGFHPELTGRENIYLNGAILGMKKQEINDKIEDIIKFAEIEKFLDLPVKRYSSGMYVRLAFSVASHLETDVLLVDEVLAVGDIAFQKKCLGKMDSISSEGRTILFVSHNLNAIEQLTRKSIFLNKGKIEYFGKTKEAIELYSNLFGSTCKTYFDCDKYRIYKDLSRKIEFESLELLCDNNTNSLPYNTPLKIRIQVKANETVNNFRFSLTIFHYDGVPIGSVFSEDSLSIKSGEFKDFILIQPLNLAPGNYYIGIATGTGDNITGHKDFDILTNILHFSVKPQESSEGIISYWASGWGHLILPKPTILQCDN